MNTHIKDIDSYISFFPSEIQQRLNAIRAVIREAAPEAKEAIKYAMPTFVLNGNLVHFAAFRHHIGFYPSPTGTSEFSQELSVYKRGKGSVQFPLDEPLPLALIAKIVEYRKAEQLNKASNKSRP